MNKQETLQVIANNVRKKHPWKISQEKYQKLFGDLPQDFLNERLAYDDILQRFKPLDSLVKFLLSVLCPIRRIFLAAFTSLRCEAPQSAQTHSLILKPLSPQGPHLEEQDEQSCVV